MRYLLALDQGTTSSRALLFDQAGRQMGVAQREFRQYFPQPGWVEHDPEEIWETQLATAREVLTLNRIKPSDVAAIGITNQRETTVVWERKTGKAIHHALVWQDRRTADICERLRADGLEPYIREQTGLVPDAYFSGTKLRWLLDVATANGYTPEDLCFGTIDTWLIWKLTGGTRHVTDASNASRTLLYNIRQHRWDETLCNALGVPAGILPEVLDSAGHFGTTVPELFGAEIPIMGVAGDQQAALFGQACFQPGEAKNTYGTGCFLLMHTGETPVISSHGLLTTIAWRLGGQVTYALEGSVFIAGAAIQWLRDGLGMIRTAAESEALAASVPDTDGVYLVPAFAGLGAPYWDMYARGILTGLTRGTTAAHITRAALESIAFQTRDVLDAMEQDAGIHLSVLRVDGGATANDLLMQFQADILGTPVQRPAYLETTAWGAACLAGIGAGLWDQAHLAARVDGPHPYQRVYMPRMGTQARDSRYTGWLAAVKQAMQHG